MNLKLLKTIILIIFFVNHVMAEIIETDSLIELKKPLRN